MISQIDIAPTLMHLLGAQGEEHFYGESVFDSADRASRAFVSNYQELGYYKNDRLIVLSPKQKVEAFRIDPVTYAASPANVDPVLLAEAIAYYQTGSRAFKQGALKAPPSVAAR
jgi:phosphoglycerol transferase MdoB-like AlkP superfamily enzyme